MTNLLQNALDSIDARRQLSSVDGAFIGVIFIKISVDDDEAMIEVVDNGMGLPPGARDRLTEPYVTTRSKGTGLGLAIVKTILEDHGARLQLEDTEDCGARVEVKIPLLERNLTINLNDVRDS